MELKELKEINPMFLVDFYKECMMVQQSPQLTKLVSYMTPRMSRVHDDHLVFFGLQAFIKEYLIDYASPETRQVGEELIKQEILKVPSDKIRAIALQHLDDIEHGQRDFRF